MRRSLPWGCCVALLIICFGCSKADQEREHEKTAEARAKVRKLGDEAKQEARSLKQNINRAVSGGPGPGTQSEAGAKLDRAAMIAKVKAKLATDVGLSTVTGVEVDASGQVVTLRGTVSSEQQRQQAEQAVRQVSGVTRVINDLRVK